jgi:hypothetical protein
MALDTSIYGQLDTQAPQKFAQLFNPAAIQAKQMQQMQQDEQRAQLEGQVKLRDMLASAGTTDPAKLSELAMQRGLYEPARQFQSDAVRSQQQARIAQQAEFDQSEKKRKANIEMTRAALAAAPDNESLTRSYLALTGVPVDTHDQTVGGILSMKPEERAAMWRMGPEKYQETVFSLRKQEEQNKAVAEREAARAKIQSERDAANADRADARLARTLAAKSDGVKAPTGYRYTDAGSLEAIPGGPADTKRIAAEEKAKAQAQKATDFADMGIGVIDQLMAEPGLKYITGMSSKLPVVPGTSQAKADSLAKQLEGQAFLQAFQSLKGGGAITNIEGEKATAAIARLQRAQSEKDYRGALTELRGILSAGRDRVASGVSVQPQGKSTSSQPVTINSSAEWQALTPGTPYVTQDGRKGVR